MFSAEYEHQIKQRENFVHAYTFTFPGPDTMLRHWRGAGASDQRERGNAADTHARLSRSAVPTAFRSLLPRSRAWAGIEESAIFQDPGHHRQVSGSAAEPYLYFDSRKLSRIINYLTLKNVSVFNFRRNAVSAKINYSANFPIYGSVPISYSLWILCHDRLFIPWLVSFKQLLAVEFLYCSQHAEVHKTVKLWFIEHCFCDTSRIRNYQKQLQQQSSATPIRQCAVVSKKLLLES